MAIKVKTVIHLELIRDGGSLAAEFRDHGGSEWILFLPINRIVDENGVEMWGFKPPVLIDTDPAKRPPDKDGRVYSVLSGPSHALTWEDAQRLTEQMADLAASVDERAVELLNDLRNAVTSRGRLSPD